MVKFIRGTDSVIIYSDVLWNTNVIVFEEYFLYNYIYALNRYFYPKCLTKEEKQKVGLLSLNKKCHRSAHVTYIL